MNNRPIDHLVLPTADLEVARTRLNKLGFTVAPVGVHPFGTINHCVYLPDGTFLEPLAIADPDAADAAIQDGNVFVARDRTFRAHHGNEGFSALVLGTGSAAADDLRFRKNGISAGKMLQFSRPFVDAAGKADMASFRLAFAAEARVPDIFFFTCERINAPMVDRSALESHANGVSRLKGVILSAENPFEFRDFLRQIANADELVAKGAGFDIVAANATISLFDTTALKARFGIADEGSAGLRLHAAVFAVANLTALETLFNANAISYDRRDQCILVPPASGQGATFVFEAV
jgi:hypothetical protein